MSLSLFISLPIYPTHSLAMLLSKKESLFLSLSSPLIHSLSHDRHET